MTRVSRGLLAAACMCAQLVPRTARAQEDDGTESWSLGPPLWVGGHLGFVRGSFEEGRRSTSPFDEDRQAGGVSVTVLPLASVTNAPPWAAPISVTIRALFSSYVGLGASGSRSVNGAALFTGRTMHWRLTPPAPTWNTDRGLRLSATAQAGLAWLDVAGERGSAGPSIRGELLLSGRRGIGVGLVAEGEIQPGRPLVGYYVTLVGGAFPRTRGMR